MPTLPTPNDATGRAVVQKSATRRLVRHGGLERSRCVHQTRIYRSTYHVAIGSV